ncbi:winged helix DNA-binding protein [Kaustia mangrovi]|uniref:Winged helix DNA-binding protein n=1 Tax=Kaustia mangrovi TaxID=2593653 RepID=A0A7S8C357_9HYPH|nr:winged helix DNA-binding protein [Kaustia mangrovi]QPC42457.1 winged helix DNA-binding protein [Kaustia mangrovi]
MTRDTPSGPIVSLSHQSDDESLPELAEYEFGLILAGHAFDRWMVRCMAAAGETGLSAMDVLVLHSVNLRERPKRLADICIVLGIEDTHLVVYAIKKLEKRGLVESTRAGKEKVIAITEKGMEVCRAYRKVREALLVQAVRELGLDPKAISAVAATLRALSGHYDQAARAAAAL